MAIRKLRIVQSDAPGVFGVCEACNQQFKSMGGGDLMEAGFDVKVQFDTHRCLVQPSQPTREYVNQAAAGIGKKTTPDH